MKWKIQWPCKWNYTRCYDEDLTVWTYLLGPNWAEVLGDGLSQSCLTLCNPMDCSPPGSSVHGISQARILKSWPRLWTCVSCIGRQILYQWATWEAPGFLTATASAKSLQSCPALCDPIDGSPLGSSVPGILQARTLEWVAISFSDAWKWKVKVKSLSHALSNPMDCSLPGSSVHGISQARVLEWVAIAFSEASL